MAKDMTLKIFKKECTRVVKRILGRIVKLDDFQEYSEYFTCYICSDDLEGEITYRKDDVICWELCGPYTDEFSEESLLDCFVQMMTKRLSKLVKEVKVTRKILERCIGE